MLPSRITELRRHNGMNQFQLAQQLHLSPSTIGMYEQGRRTPGIDILIQMSKLFHVSLDYLITGREYNPSSEKATANCIFDSCTCPHCCCHKIMDILQRNDSKNHNC